MKIKGILTVLLVGIMCLGGALVASAAEFNAEWYAQQYPDVVEAVGNSPEALKRHYDTYGRSEGRAANDNDVEAQLRKLFDPKEYAAFYPDVVAAYGDSTEALFQHYISFGILERRRPSDEVSYEAAVAMRDTVVQAMERAGIEVQPGSAQLAAVIEGSVANAAGGAVVQQALTQVQTVVQQAVAETVYDVENPPEDDDDEEEENVGAEESSAGSAYDVCPHYDPATYMTTGSLYDHFIEGDCTKGGLVKWYCFACETENGYENATYVLGTIGAESAHNFSESSEHCTNTTPGGSGCMVNKPNSGSPSSTD